MPQLAVGLGGSTADVVLDALLNSVSYFGATNIWIQLHTGGPGAAGTNNVATNTTRKQVDPFTIASHQGTNSVAASWASVPATETYTNASYWSASTAGSFLFSGTITNGAVTVGDTFTLAIGTVVVTFNIAG